MNPDFNWVLMTRIFFSSVAIEGPIKRDFRNPFWSLARATWGGAECPKKAKLPLVIALAPKRCTQ